MRSHAREDDFVQAPRLKFTHYIHVHMFNFYWIQPSGNGGGYDNDGSPKIIVFHLDSSPNMCLVFLTMLFALLPQLELFTDKFSLSLDSIGITNPTKQG